MTTRAPPHPSPWTHPAPALAIDAKLAAIRGQPLNLSPNQVRERQAVAFILDNLAAAGFKPSGQVRDGFGGEESGEATDTKSAMETIFNLDEARVYMVDAAGKEVGHLYFVRGNSPEEVLSDWSWKKSQGEDPKGFNKTLDAITKRLWNDDAEKARREWLEEARRLLGLWAGDVFAWPHAHDRARWSAPPQVQADDAVYAEHERVTPILKLADATPYGFARYGGRIKRASLLDLPAVLDGLEEDKEVQA